MSEMALRAAAPDSLRRLAEVLGRMFGGIAESVSAARRYESLKTLSDAELARLGITREDVPWFGLYGEPRPR